MKALIVLNLEDCTFDEIDEAEIKEISLIYQDKETGKKCDFLWETGFKIMSIPEKISVLDVPSKYKDFGNAFSLARGYNACIDEILGEEQ